MKASESKTLVTGTRVRDNKYGLGEGTVVGVSAGPKGYWEIEFDNGESYRCGYRTLDLI